MVAQRQDPAYRPAKGKPRSGGAFLSVEPLVITTRRARQQLWVGGRARHQQSVRRCQGNAKVLIAVDHYGPANLAVHAAARCNRHAVVVSQDYLIGATQTHWTREARRHYLRRVVGPEARHVVQERHRMQYTVIRAHAQVGRLETPPTGGWSGSWLTRPRCIPRLSRASPPRRGSRPDHACRTCRIGSWSANSDSTGTTSISTAYVGG
jgi:hypothetical protein